MPRVLVTAKSFIGNTIVEAGTELTDYDGPIGSNLELLDKPKAKGKGAAQATPEPEPEPVVEENLV